SARVQRTPSGSEPGSTMSSGKSRPSPLRCSCSTTTCVSSRATGSTTTLVTVPQGPSLHVTAVPMVNVVSDMTASFFRQDPTGHAMLLSDSRCCGAAASPAAQVHVPAVDDLVAVDHEQVLVIGDG